MNPKLRRESKSKFYVRQQVAIMLKYARKKAGITQVHLAILSGLEQTYLERLEDGNAEVMFTTLIKLLSCCNCDMNVALKALDGQKVDFELCPDECK